MQYVDMESFRILYHLIKEFKIFYFYSVYCNDSRINSILSSKVVGLKIGIYISFVYSFVRIILLLQTFEQIKIFFLREILFCLYRKLLSNATDCKAPG